MLKLGSGKRKQKTKLRRAKLIRSEMRGDGKIDIYAKDKRSRKQIKFMDCELKKIGDITFEGTAVRIKDMRVEKTGDIIYETE